MYSHAPEIPEEPRNSAAGNHWQHDPGKSADTDYFHGVTDYFQVYFSGKCRFLLNLPDLFYLSGFVSHDAQQN
jgi:hypothetical protein